ncbi:MAG TPA: hypothetical protein VJ960_00960, partial [Oceanipulchritudo sp.]|nr:hypothetical protein [Oceanipulchritudo sp.]
MKTIHETPSHANASAPAETASPAPVKGADLLVHCLEREGVDVIFAYPGGASMEIHQGLTRS